MCPQHQLSSSPSQIFEVNWGRVSGPGLKSPHWFFFDFRRNSWWEKTLGEGEPQDVLTPGWRSCCLHACSGRARFLPGWVASCQLGNPKLSADLHTSRCAGCFWSGFRRCCAFSRRGKRFGGFPGIHLPYDKLWHFRLWAGSDGSRARREGWYSLPVCLLPYLKSETWWK